MRIATKFTVACSAVLVAGFAGAGIASAEPNVDAIVNSTCNYGQVIAALNAQDPALAAQLTSNSQANGFLQSLIAADPNGRRNMIAFLQGYPEMATYAGTINSVATSCQNF